MFGSTNTKLWSGGTQYGYIMAEYPEGSQCQITRELDDTVLKARGSGGNWAFALPEMITSIKVPNEYQQVDYIEATGTQCIILTFPTAVDVMALRYVMDILMKPTSSTSVMIGNSNPQPYFGAPFCNNSNFYPICTYNGGNESPANNSLLNQRFTYELIGSNGYITVKANDNIWVENSARNSSTRTQIGIFSEVQGSYRWKASGRLYHLTIYGTDHVTKLFDLYPVYRKTDSVIGLYDVVNNFFYTNNGTGTFITGPIVGEEWIAYCTDGENEAERKVNILYNGDVKQTSLNYHIPIEYQEVKYLEKRGQYVIIDTGLMCQQNSNIIVNYYYGVNSSRNMVFGATNSNKSVYFALQSHDNNAMVWAYYGGISLNSGVASSRLQKWTKIVFSNGQKIELFDEDGTILRTVTGTTTGAPAYSMAIFAIHNSGGYDAIDGCTMRFGLIWIDDNELVPCYRKSDSTPGYFNIKTKEFYTNSGTGLIYLGPEIE